MKRTLSVLSALISLAVMIGAGRAQAQDLAATSANADLNLVHDTDQGPSQNFNRRWDGARYDGAQFDVGVHSGLGSALLDLDLNDLRSGEEGGKLELGLGSSVLLKGDFSTLTHRDGFLMNGLMINNQFVPDNNVTYAVGMSTGFAQEIKREYQEEELDLFLPETPYRLFVGQWEQHEYGQTALALSNKVYSESVSNYTQQIYGGVDVDVSDKGQAYFEAAFRKYQDNASSNAYATRTANIVGYQPNSDLTTNKVAFKYNPSGILSLAGSLVERQRFNRFNGLTQGSYAGNLSGSYRPTKDLSLTTRLYARGVQTTYVTPYAGAAGAPVEPIDFLFLNGDFDLRYTGYKNVVLSAGYRPQITTRSNTNQWGEVYTSTAFINGRSAGVNQPAGTDTRHNLSGKAIVALPNDVELELSENYVNANAEAYENTPTLAYVEGVSLTVPLPQNIAWMGALEDSYSQNTHSTFSNFKEKKDTLMTGLEWSDAKGRGSVGLNYAYERGTDSTDAYYSISGQGVPITRGIAGPTLAVIESAAPYNFSNHVLSVNAMVRPIEKLHVNGNFSYTDSMGSFLTMAAFNQYLSGTQVGGRWTTGQAFNPTDLLIVHWGVSANYQVSRFVTARAGMRYDSWIDRVNSANDGTNTVYDLGLDYKF